MKDIKNFKEYYSTREIVRQLCKIRIRFAKQRNSKIIIDRLSKNSLNPDANLGEYERKILDELNEILPPRRLWLTKGQRTFKIVKDERTGIIELVNLSAEEKNREILYNTITKYSKEVDRPEFIRKLFDFILTIQRDIDNKVYHISKPNILPEVKETNKSKVKYLKLNSKTIDCRPISRFSLKDRIVISITNRFLTNVFDEFFEESSYAFRSVTGSSATPKNHHIAINNILAYQKENLGVKLYVAECDIKKFFDSVSHQKCIQLFNSLMIKAKQKYPSLNFDTSVAIFKSYLNSYNFYQNVHVECNLNSQYWRNLNPSDGAINKYSFGWIHDVDKIQSDQYNNLIFKDIGVPQGGALSGLIANIMLDQADKKMFSFQKVFYARYCDDMILMHKNKEEVTAAMKEYIDIIKHLQLIVHTPCTAFYNKNSSYPKLVGSFNKSYQYSYKSFWKEKSKGPYLWDKFDIVTQAIPWIGFVGYEIKYDGCIRVRKRSLRKEMTKQSRVVSKVIQRIHRGKSVSNTSILRSVIERLNGMSVGRITLYNYATTVNKLCWVEGFKSLFLNRYSAQQLKSLDRNKYRSINILKKFIGSEVEKPSKLNQKQGEIYLMKKPFSYYYQAGERKKTT
jgi:hypothetical protein